MDRELKLSRRFARRATRLQQDADAAFIAGERAGIELAARQWAREEWADAILSTSCARG